MAPWLFHRISGVILIFLVALKIYTGYGLEKPAILPAFLVGYHQKAWLDISLLFFVCFHVAYGLRLMLIDLGLTWDRFLFWFFTALAAVAFGASYWALYIHF